MLSLLFFYTLAEINLLVRKTAAFYLNIGLFYESEDRTCDCCAAQPFAACLTTSQSDSLRSCESAAALVECFDFRGAQYSASFIT